jgi:flagellar export protein FliJ
MKAFDFSFQTLLDSKEALEQATEMRMGEAMRRLQDSRARLDNMRSRLRNQITRSEKLTGHKTTGDELATHSKHLSWLQQQIEQQLKRVATLERNAEKLREQLIGLMREVKSMERLKQKQKTVWTIEKNHEEQGEMDEIAVRKHYALRDKE